MSMDMPEPDDMIAEAAGELRCVACGRDGDDVALYTPDLDIAAVALCRVDWAVLFFGLDPAMSPTAAGRRYWERLDVAAGGDDG